MSEKLPCPRCHRSRWVAYNAGQRDLAAALVCTECVREAEDVPLPPRKWQRHPDGKPMERLRKLVRATARFLRDPRDPIVLTELAERLAAEKDVSACGPAEWRARLVRAVGMALVEQTTEAA